MTSEPLRFWFVWFVWFMVAWGAPLALHVGFVIGLFGGRNLDLEEKDDNE